MKLKKVCTMALLLNFAACGQVQSEKLNQGSSMAGVDEDIVPPYLLHRLQVSRNNKFALKLYKESFMATKPNEFRVPANSMVSPYSISSALAMVYLGADSTTLSQMSQVLEFPSQEETAKSFASINGRLSAVKEFNGYQLSVANRVWGQKAFAWKSDFLKTLETNFTGSALAPVDFSQTEQARSEINKWVEHKTNDKIKELLERGVLTSDTRMVLTNAIYFNGEWVHKFSEKLTVKNAEFLSVNGKTKVDMMTSGPSPLLLNYVDSAELSAQVIELPYAFKEPTVSGSKLKTNGLSMVVLLPKEGIMDTESKLVKSDADSLFAALNKNKTWVNVSLPKWKTEFSGSLTSTLKELGMTDAFSEEKANFSKMFNREKIGNNLFISEVVHKTFISVTEGGTEAAGATAVVGRITSGIFPNSTVNFYANRPFIYMIKDNQSQAILFLGRYTGLDSNR